METFQPNNRNLFRMAMVSALAVTMTSAGAAVSIQALDNIATSYGLSINNLGQVTGHVYSFDYSHGAAFISTGEQIQIIETSGGEGEAINDAGQVAGRRLVGSLPARSEGFFYDGTVAHAVGLPGETYSAALGINEAGQAVGFSADATNVIRPILHTPGHGTAVIEGLPAESIAKGINDSGTIIGNYQKDGNHRRAFVLANGVMTDIGSTQPFYSDASAINNKGQVTGYAAGIEGGGAYIYEDGQLHGIGGLSRYSSGHAINDLGQVVGSYAPSEGSLTERAFMYSKASGLIDLTSLLPADAGWELRFATNINDRGEVVGWGMYDGDLRAFKMTGVSAVPEPQTLLLALAGVAVLARRMQRR